ncbi:hypothetical protein [Salmonirosea aquatica]|uniref:Uncharacterized protein n=1 Tax=Salmonirosea aquatica TaxID=2654236 RepID=A0A7C9FBW5_9BACT|nr:hypothetical protein [Cytophagaceae bacterium SJW1-29]
MKIAYYLEPDQKENLFCCIKEGETRVSFPIGYTVSTEEWHEREDGIPIYDPQHATLMNFKEYLSKRYHELTTLEMSTAVILETLRKEAEHLLTRRV